MEKIVDTRWQGALSATRDVYFRCRHHAPSAAIAAPAPSRLSVPGSGTGTLPAWAAWATRNNWATTVAAIKNHVRFIWSSSSSAPRRARVTTSTVPGDVGIDRRDHDGVQLQHQASAVKTIKWLEVTP